MVPISKIIDFVSTIKSVLGDGYSIQIKISKEQVEPDKDDLSIDPQDISDLDESH
jgi:hypothetical protein